MKKKLKIVKRPKVNLIISHVNHTFVILDLQIGLETFKDTHYTLGEKCIFNVEKI
jgi:hypothetical protein